MTVAEQRKARRDSMNRAKNPTRHSKCALTARHKLSKIPRIFTSR